MGSVTDDKLCMWPESEGGCILGYYDYKVMNQISKTLKA